MDRVHIPRETVLPARDRSFWQAYSDGTGGLQYLAWGERRFGVDPIPLRRHVGWVFTVILSGTPTLLREDGRQRLRVGDGFVAGGDVGFGWTGRPSERCTFLMWMWDAPVTKCFPGEQPDYFVPLRLKPAEQEELARWHAFCRREALRADWASEPILRGCQQIIEGLFARAREKSRRREPAGARLELALRWLRTHLSSREPAARLSDYLGVSSSTLHRWFKRSLGESPAAVVHRLKMEAAQSWLAQGEPSIKEIAFRLGYRHFSDFSRAFKASTGRSPSAFRAAAVRLASGPAEGGPRKRGDREGEAC